MNQKDLAFYILYKGSIPLPEECSRKTKIPILSCWPAAPLFAEGEGGRTAVSYHKNQLLDGLGAVYSLPQELDVRWDGGIA